MQTKRNNNDKHLTDILHLTIILLGVTLILSLFFTLIGLQLIHMCIYESEFNLNASIINKFSPNSVILLDARRTPSFLNPEFEIRTTYS